jgi:site-specific recombinase XerD
MNGKIRYEVEVISQILGHSDLATTNIYLDSFSSNIIDEAVKVL